MNDEDARTFEILRKTPEYYGISPREAGKVIFGMLQESRRQDRGERR